MTELSQSQSGAAALAELQAGLQNETEEQRFARAQQEAATARASTDEMLVRFGFIGDTGGTGGQGGGTTAPAGMAAGDVAAEDAAFARAKDKIGAVNESAKRSLSESMASRGISGSGVEAQQLGNVEAAGAGQLADVAQQGALETLKRRYQVADRDAALASTKRGQDVGLVQTLAGANKPSGGGTY